MPVNWPSGLQQLLNEDNFGNDFGDTTIRSDMDVGPAKVRRRTTRPIDSITNSINLTTAQYTTLKNFYNTDLNGGVNTFYFIHPITAVQVIARFTSPPKIRSLGGGQFRANMTWEILGNA